MLRCLFALLLVHGCGGLDHKIPDGDKQPDTGALGPGDSAFHALDSADHDATNHRPVADAGVDAEANVAAVVDLDGSGSTDPDGDALSYLWSFNSVPAGSSTILLNPTRVDAQFVPDVEGEFVVRLLVDDGDLQSDPDDVVITAAEADEPPVADAGYDQSVAIGSYVELDGGGSRDPEGASLSYRWTLVSSPAGSAAVLFGEGTVTPNFEADAQGRYTIELVVNDGGQDSQPDSVDVTAEESSSSGCGCARAVEVQVKRRASWVLVFVPAAWGWRRRRWSIEPGDYLG